MADTTAVSFTEASEKNLTNVAGINPVYTRTIKGTLPGCGKQYSGDTITFAAAVPAGSTIIGFAVKSSVAQTGTLTFNLDSQSAFTGALTCTAADTWYVGAVTAANACTDTEATLKGLIGSAALNDGTVTIKLTMITHAGIVSATTFTI